MKSILSSFIFLSLPINIHYYDLKNPMDPKCLKWTDFQKIKLYVAKKKERIDVQIPATMPTGKRTCQSDCFSSNRKRNGVLLPGCLCK